MIVFHLQRTAHRQSSLVLVFGLGLIGQSIADTLIRFEHATSHFMPYDWNDPTRRAQHRADILEVIRAYRGNDPERLALVWAGGRSGFASDMDTIVAEVALFGEVLAILDDARGILPEARPAVHLMSSAGGLFEGLTHCDIRTQPTPQRPYGIGKLQQEDLVHSLDREITKRVYRPSSVYGFSLGGRTGLICALIKNGLMGQPTRIVGHYNTLRDYVLVNDIGRFVTHELLFADNTSEKVHLLAKGRSASMYEVIATVRRVLQKDLFLQFDPNPSNALDIGFLPSALPKLWRPSDLLEGVAHVATRLRQDWAEAVWKLPIRRLA